VINEKQISFWLFMNKEKFMKTEKRYNGNMLQRNAGNVMIQAVWVQQESRNISQLANAVDLLTALEEKADIQTDYVQLC